jgi:3-oxoisoapionate kinase
MAAVARYGWYGDDFTGATDTLGALAQAGQRAMLFLGVPSAAHLEAAGALDAIGIAGAARAMSPAAMETELEPVGGFFAAQGVRVLHYKCCSTFDSAPHIGSIGAAVRSLRAHFPGATVPIVGGQPNIGRYCLFSNLYAAAGIGGEVHRIDRHPTMSAHPVTPMGEADLRRHLASQGLEGIAAIYYPAYAQSEAALDALMARFAGDGRPAVLLDIAEPAHLAVAGRLIWNEAQKAPLLAVGASSVAQALTAHWAGKAGDAAPSATTGLASADGPVFLMVGSLSPVTRRQVEAAGETYIHFHADAQSLIARDDAADALLADVVAALRDGRNVMVVTAPAEGQTADIASAPRVAEATAAFLAEVMRQAPVMRLGVAGGDTSSRAVAALKLWGLSYLMAPGPGVAICRAHADHPDLDGMEVMLKGGQMGPPDLFVRLVEGTAG